MRRVDCARRPGEPIPLQVKPQSMTSNFNVHFGRKHVAVDSIIGILHPGRSFQSMFVASVITSLATNIAMETDLLLCATGPLTIQED